MTSQQPERPLRDVLFDLGQLSKQLAQLDDEIAGKLEHVEKILRDRYKDQYPIDVPFEPWGKLAWSQRRGRWRLMVIDEDAAWPLLSMPRLCRTDACRVLRKLLERAGLL